MDYERAETIEICQFGITVCDEVIALGEELEHPVDFEPWRIQRFLCLKVLRLAVGFQEVPEQLMAEMLEPMPPPEY